MNKIYRIISLGFIIGLGFGFIIHLYGKSFFNLDPNWVIAIFTIISIPVTAFFFLRDFHARKKLESARLIMDILSKFVTDENKDTNKRIDLHLLEGKTFDVGKTLESKERRAIYNYLSELEVVCDCYFEGILTIEQTYELLGSTIIDALRVEPITKLIADERKSPHQSDLYDNLQKGWKEMIEYQRKKQKNTKKTPEEIISFVEKNTKEK